MCAFLCVLSTWLMLQFLLLVADGKAPLLSPVPCSCILFFTFFLQVACLCWFREASFYGQWLFFFCVCAHQCQPQWQLCLCVKSLHVLGRVARSGKSRSRSSGFCNYTRTVATSLRLPSEACSKHFVWWHKTEERTARLGLVQKQFCHVHMLS